MTILQVAKYYILIKKRVTEQVKFPNSFLGQAFKNQKIQLKIKAKNKEKQLVVFNEIVKKDFNIDRDSIQIQEQKKLINLFKKNHMNFRI